MPPLTRRRSARLASNSKPTGSAAAPNLDSLTEQTEIDDQPASPYVNTPKTPAGSSPAKPSVSEMRPGKANGPKEPPSSALRLGFADIRSSRIDSPTTAKSIKIAASTIPTIMTTNLPEDTPSKRRSPLTAASPFTFRYSRRNDTPVKDAPEFDEAPVSMKKTTAIDTGLSEDARRMMEELRGEAQKIRAGLEVEREKERAAEEELGRKIAKPKSRAGRFSAAHSAQFDKMDSIANHPSAYRASKFTPVKSKAPSTAGTPTTTGPTRGLKRTQSKANLDDTPNAKSARTPGPAPTPGSAVASTAKKYNPLFGSSIAGAEFKAPPSVRKGNLLFPPVHEQKQEQPMPAAKRIKQNIGDDASSSRPMSRDGAGSSLPRPAGLTGLASTGASSASGLTRSHTTASIVTPTKSVLSRPTIAKTPTSSLQPQTPSKTPARLPSALKKSVSTNSLHAAAKPATVETAKTTTKPQVPVQSARKPEARKMATLAPPSASRAMANSSAVRSTLPVSAAPAVKVFASKTPAPERVANRALPRFPATTPRRKVSKHVSFTPTTEQALMSEKSPSVFRSGIPRSALKSHQQLKPTDMDVDSAGASSAANGSPSVRRRFGATVFYPDLTGHELLVGSEEASDSADAADAGVPSPSAKLAPPPPSVPGSFTFRSDKTINFSEKPSKGFGSSPGQSSIRQVRSSTSTAPEPKIPGSFPEVAPMIKAFTALVPTVGANKENARPVAVSIPHGITNKKRQRISEAEEEAEQEASERAAKKRKNERVPEGEALLAPRLAGKTMPAARGLGVIRGTPQKASPQKMAAPTPSAAGAKTPASAKKRPMISMSRLNSLARPKLRK